MTTATTRQTTVARYRPRGVEMTPIEKMTIPEIIAWRDRKDAQWKGVRNAMPGLSLSVTGPRNTEFILRVQSAANKEEAIVFGRLPRGRDQHNPPKGFPGHTSNRPVGDFLRTIEVDPGIDLSDADIDALITRWKADLSTWTAAQAAKASEPAKA